MELPSSVILLFPPPVCVRYRLKDPVREGRAVQETQSSARSSCCLPQWHGRLVACQHLIIRTGECHPIMLLRLPLCVALAPWEGSELHGPGSAARAHTPRASRTITGGLASQRPRKDLINCVWKRNWGKKANCSQAPTPVTSDQPAVAPFIRDLQHRGLGPFPFPGLHPVDEPALWLAGRFFTIFSSQ